MASRNLYIMPSRDVLLKRLECSECGATVADLVLTCDDAVEYWNSKNKEGKRAVLERVGVELCRDIEQEKEALKDAVD